MGFTPANPVVPAGSISDHYREQLAINPGAYNPAGTNDDYRSNATFDNQPARLTRQHDTTAYPAFQSDDSWIMHIKQFRGTV
jgi:hypothetical protein